MNVLLLGSGGREHALAWKLAQSPRLSKLFIAPGNAGTAACGTNVAVGVDDFPAIRELVLRESISMVVVGPEAPLVKGIRDYFEADDALHAVPVIGPGKSGARLEGSKAFSKAFMERHAIPTAAYRSFGSDALSEAIAFLDRLNSPYVLKADGLAAGKGVLIVEDKATAAEELRAMLTEAKFGAASETVVIEEFLQGIEVSVFALTDGDSYVLLPEAKDYKRIGEGDTGLNTGGMGAVSPVPFADAGFWQKVETRIVQPTVQGLKAEGIPYQGFLFFGLMNVAGDPYVIEYNARMGDPETEVVMPRLKTDLLALFEAVAAGELGRMDVETDPRAAATVMLVSGGYPEGYEKGKAISGLDAVSAEMVFHAGTRQEADQVLTSGGRVIAVTAFGTDHKEALAQAYGGAAHINFERKYLRKDIGFDL